MDAKSPSGREPKPQNFFPCHSSGYSGIGLVIHSLVDLYRPGSFFCFYEISFFGLVNLQGLLSFHHSVGILLVLSCQTIFVLLFKYLGLVFVRFELVWLHLQFDPVYDKSQFFQGLFELREGTGAINQLSEILGVRELVGYNEAQQSCSFAGSGGHFKNS